MGGFVVFARIGRFFFFFLRCLFFYLGARELAAQRVAGSASFGSTE
jgi:hypothetical protein